LFEDPSDAGTGPDVAEETVGLGPMPEELGDQTLLSLGEFGRMARARPRPERLCSAFMGASEPTAHGVLGNVQGFGNVSLIPALLFQVQRPQPPPLTPVMRKELGCLHPLIVQPKSSTLLAQRSVDREQLPPPVHPHQLPLCEQAPIDQTAHI